ncbi:cytochrome P450 [Kitasatospora sp. NPDC089509]|uniref:cytochrome P450 n=1 Tax=Kitasatospora sp. NPDC089509 TaxID=3364079 RepID=UPI00382DC380
MSSADPIGPPPSASGSARALPAPGARPVIGHLGAFLASPLAFLRGLPAHGGLVEVRLGPQRLLVVCDPALTREVLTHDRVFDKGGVLFDRMRDVAGNGLVTCPARDHRRQRRLIQPAFHRAQLPRYAETMTERIDAVVSSWQPGRRIELVGATRSVAAEVLLSTIFGTALAAEAVRSLDEDLQTLLTAVMRRAVLPAPLAALPTPGNLRYRRAGRRARETMAELVRTLRRNPGDGMFGALLAAGDASGGADGTDRPFTDEELVDQAVTMYAAGTETTAGVVCWALYLAARDREAGRRLTEECRSVLGTRPAGWDDLPRLRYARQTLLEAVRFKPPGWLLTRTAAADATLGPYRVPRGSTLAYSPYVLAQDPALHERPERFDPDRWAPEAGGPAVPAAAFGGGARKCIGDEYGLTEGVLMLATITARWDLHIGPHDLKRPHLPSLTLNPTRLTATVTRPRGPAAG